MNRYFAVFVGLIFIFPLASTAFGGEPETLLGSAPAYRPRMIDYSFEVGLTHVDQDLFWGAGSMGVQLGRCVFSQNEGCRQYLDGIVGVGVREAETDGLFLSSLRWQYTGSAKRYSPFWRVFAGAANINQAPGERWVLAEGVGVGVTTYLHDKIDLRLEVRAGAMDRGFVQGLVGIQIKVDRLLTLFVKKVGAFGKGTVDTAIEATGTALKATKEGVGGIAHGVAAPFKGDKKEDRPSNPPHDQPVK